MSLDRTKFLEKEYTYLRQQIDDCRARIFKLSVGALFVIPAAELVVGIGKGIALRSQEPASTTPGDQGVTEITQTAVAMVNGPLMVVSLFLPLIVPGIYAIFMAEHLRITRSAFYIRNYVEPNVAGWHNETKWHDKEDSESNRRWFRGYQSFLGPALLEEDTEGTRAAEKIQRWAFNILYSGVYTGTAIAALLMLITYQQSVPGPPHFSPPFTWVSAVLHWQLLPWLVGGIYVASAPAVAIFVYSQRNETRKKLSNETRHIEGPQPSTDTQPSPTQRANTLSS